MMRKRTASLLAAVLLVPTAAAAQASIAGVVRDTSGAVLPGVTVEAASPALIEKVRTVVTDGNGQYRIIDLRPGAYTVTFTLPGFATIKREGLELSGSATVNANAEMRVGALEETLTVTGETPLVDTQNAVRQAVLSKDVVDAIPTGRYYGNLATLVPAINIAAAPGSTSGSTQDVGGSNGDAQNTLTVHGSRPGDQRFTINGIPFGEGNGSTHGMGPNVNQMQEVVIDAGAVDAQMPQGGVRINFIPRDGGNRFSGGISYSGTRESWQGDNLNAELRSRGATQGNRLTRLYDVGPVFGGPILRDRLWFFTSWRRNLVDDIVPNIYFNTTAADPTARFYTPDTSRPFVAHNLFRWAGVRLTYQANDKNKFAVSYDWKDRCGCTQANTIAGVTTAPVSPEANTSVEFKPMNVTAVTWASPVTNQLLFDAGVNYLQAHQEFLPTDWAVPGGGISKLETAPRPGTPAAFGGRLLLTHRDFPSLNGRVGTTYVTGTHAFATGVQFNRGKNVQDDYAANPSFPVIYTLTNGVPTQVTVNAFPQYFDARGTEIGIYAQDKWTRGRLTLSGGLRFDYLHTYTPDINLGPAPMLPTRNIALPASDMLRWKDIAPKFNAILDVSGDGRTAIKASVNKYIAQQGPAGAGQVNLQPAFFVQQSAARAWTDSNNNFFPDCDLRSGAAQNNTAAGGDICGAWTGASANFGRSNPATNVDPDLKSGWGKRPFNWETSIGIQRSLNSRMSAEISYFRRWYGNFWVTDNRAVTAADYSSFSVTAPADARLPNGGGYAIPGFVNINPDKATVPVDNILTFSKNYGKQIEHWNGIDTSFSVRFGRGALIQAGTSTGRTSTDNCEVLAKVPEGSIGTPAATTFQTTGAAGTVPYCHIDTNWLTNVKGLGSYILPKIDVQVAATFQSIPGPMLWSTLVVPTATVAQTLGRPLAGGAANVAVNILEPGKTFGDRLNQFDIRFGKILRYKTTRSSVNLDLFNVFNSNAVTAENTNYSSFRVPSAIIPPRIIKVSVQFDF